MSEVVLPGAEEPAARTVRLSPRESRILHLLASGYDDAAAAHELHMGVKHYRRRVAELMAGLGAESRFQAGVRARQLGLV